MNIGTFGFILTGIFLNAIAQLLLKKGTNAIGAIHLTAENWFSIGVQLATQLPIIGGLTCYVVSVGVWIIGLSRVDVTIAYPLLSIGYIVNAIGAWYFSWGDDVATKDVGDWRHYHWSCLACEELGCNSCAL